MQDPQDFRNDFHWAGKSKLPPSRTLRVWTKNEENLKFWKKSLRYFDQNLYWKLTFFTFFTKFFLDFCLLSESIYLCKINQISATMFPISVGGGRSGVPPPSTLLQLWVTIQNNSSNPLECLMMTRDNAGSVIPDRASLYKNT